MKKSTTFYVAVFATLISLQIDAQPAIRVDVSSDTIQVGQTVEVKYSIENGEGIFDFPDFNSLPLISGPNSSSSFLIQNGQKSISQTYSIVLKAFRVEDIIIPEAKYTEKGETTIIDPVKIVVVENLQSSSPPKSSVTPPKVNREKKKF